MFPGVREAHSKAKASELGSQQTPTHLNLNHLADALLTHVVGDLMAVASPLHHSHFIVDHD